MKTWFNGLSSENQFRFTILAIVVIVLLYVALRGSVRGFISGLNTGAELGGLQASGVQPSYTNSQYILMADQLYVAMKGWGTDEDVIFSVFNKIFNDVDMIKLDMAFGVRDNYDMRYWLRDDLSAADVAKINQTLINKNISKLI